MVTVIFEAHATSLDNEAHLSSGQYDVALSLLGEKQAKELGESYEQTSQRMKSFLNDLKKNFDNPPIGETSKKVMIIGHRATQYGLEYLINGVSLKDVIRALWSWQPGWTYFF